MQLSDADLHLHTSCSDGRLSPEALARRLERSGLAVAAVTDHDTVEGALRVRRALAGRGPEIVIGSEISTADGHVLALYLDHDLPAGRPAAETVAAIHRAGALAVAVHPYLPACSVGDLAGSLPFDAVEVLNGTPLGEWANRRARRRLGPAARAAVGGSDAHVAAQVGHVLTRFPGRTAADLRAAIEAGEVRAAMDWRRHLACFPVYLPWQLWITLRPWAGQGPRAEVITRETEAEQTA